MLTKKDFTATARGIRQIKDPLARAAQTEYMIAMFQNSNPRFDARRFRLACGIDPRGNKPLEMDTGKNQGRPKRKLDLTED